jgi:hypothetical protein
MWLNRRLFIASAIGVLLSFCVSAQDESGWKLAKSGDGVEIYTRTSSGSKVNEFKAVTSVSQSPETVEKLIDDISSYTRWQDNCDYAALVERVNATTVVGHYTATTPFPFSDRDIVIEARKERKGAELHYYLRSVPNKVPERKKYVRIIDAGGHWVLTPRSDGGTDIVYAFYADPAGSIPGWLVNMFIVQGPYNSMHRLKKILND